MDKQYLLVKDFLSKDVSNFLFEYMKVNASEQQYYALHNNTPTIPCGQVKTCIASYSKNSTFDTLLKICHKKMETITGVQLYPTYTYGRMYNDGDQLKVHKDRPACEYSVTIKLGDTGETNWPIYMGDTAIELDDGDAVVYKGLEIKHYRKRLVAPKSYRMGQIFLHYVDKNGPYANHRFDKDPQKLYYLSKEL